MKPHLGIYLCMAMATFAVSSSADEPEPFRDFTFKRLKVPSAASTRRITVQIDPYAVIDKEEPEASKPEPDADTIGPLDWFWAVVSPSISAQSPARLEDAVRILTSEKHNRDVSFPRMQGLQDIASAYGKTILGATIGTRVSPALVLAVISVESGGKTDAESGAGAQGLMQLIPATAERFSVPDATNPADNIRGGIAYLDWLMNEFDGDPVLVLAAYNSGENSVKKYQGVPPFPETRAYVPKVLSAWTVARGLCLTPPQLVSDGCVFAALGVRKDG